MRRAGVLQSSHDEGDDVDTAASVPAMNAASTSADFSKAAKCTIGNFNDGDSNDTGLKVAPDKYKVLLEIQAILRTLREEPVRRDFIAGRIIKVDLPEEVLQSFDAAYDVFHPNWIATQVNRGLHLSEVLNHVELLITGSESHFIVPNKNFKQKSFTYKVWMHAFKKLMASSYWLLPPQKCAASDESLDSYKEVKINTRRKTAKFCRAPMSGTSDSDETYVSNRKIRQKGTSKSKKVIETIVLSDSSTGSSADDESPDSSFVGCLGSRAARYYSKEVVQPAVFDMNGKQSLKQFLDTYERYFRKKFDGSQWECTQELGKFIAGELRDAYDALGGPQRKYRDMKQELLQWYKTQRVGKTHQWQVEFRQAAMRHKESLKLYCMRLKEMAQRAYPGNEKECAKQLRRKLLGTAPASFLDRVEKREETKDMLELGKRLTWGEIVDLAEKEDKKRRKAAYYQQLDESDNDMIERLQRLKCSAATATGKSSPEKVYASSRYMNQPKSANVFVSCQWCGKPGHSEEMCWLKKGACTICGNTSHKRLDCPKFNKPKVSPSKPQCPVCRGPHLGKDCRRKSNQSIVLPSLLEDGRMEPLN